MEAKTKPSLAIIILFIALFFCCITFITILRIQIAGNNISEVHLHDTYIVIPNWLYIGLLLPFATLIVCLFRGHKKSFGSIGTNAVIIVSLIILIFDLTFWYKLFQVVMVSGSSFPSNPKTKLFIIENLLIATELITGSFLLYFIYGRLINKKVDSNF